MGSKPKVPPPPPPPPAPLDEADAAPVARLALQRQTMAIQGYRKAFMSGPRGPGGPAWQAPETAVGGTPARTAPAPAPGSATRVTNVTPENYDRNEPIGSQANPSTGRGGTTPKYPRQRAR